MDWYDPLEDQMPKAEWDNAWAVPFLVLAENNTGGCFGIGTKLANSTVIIKKTTCFRNRVLRE